MRLHLLAIVALILTGCESAISVVEEDRPSFHIDAEKPWKIELGRGSGLHGLETVMLDDTGQVVLHRMMSPERREETALYWESATTILSEGSVSSLLNAVEANQLMELDKAYHDTRILDGTQWVLWIQQEDQSKSVYFNNHFPEQIKKFAQALDEIVLEDSTLNLIWRPVPETDMRSHERELWDKLDR